MKRTKIEQDEINNTVRNYEEAKELMEKASVENASPIAQWNTQVKYEKAKELMEKAEIQKQVEDLQEIIRTAKEEAKTPEQIAREVIELILCPVKPHKRLSKADKIQADAEALSKQRMLKSLQNSAKRDKRKPK